MTPPGVPNQGFAYRERVGADAAGRTALEHLTARHDHSPEPVWRERFEAGELELQGRRASPDDVLRAGDWLVWHRPPWVEPPVPLSFDLLFEDEHLLAVSKPSGLPTLPGGGFLEHTLLALVRARAPEASPMHRLGRGTSGLVLFGRTPLAGKALQQQWRGRQVKKLYLALASGRPAWQTLQIDEPIGKVPHPVLGELFAATPQGRPSKSVARLLEQRDDSALLEVEIETGRPHQIRIHLAAAGHPLVGDPLYVAGGRAVEGATTLPGETGYYLHAHRLVFAHPATQATVDLVAPAPNVLRVG